MNIKIIATLSAFVLCLAFYVGKVTADKIAENERQETTQEALRRLEDYFLFQQKANESRDSHYLMRKIIEANCAKVNEPLGNCRYMPTELKEKFQRFDQLFTKEVSKTSSLAKCPKVTKKGWSEEESYWIQKAYDISECNKDFVAKLNGENGLWDLKRQSNVIDKNGVRETSYGFCQIHTRWHSAIVNDPRFFTDQEWQLNKCWEMFKRGTPMYAPKAFADLIFEA